MKIISTLLALLLSTCAFGYVGSPETAAPEHTLAAPAGSPDEDLIVMEDDLEDEETEEEESNVHN